MSPPPQPLKKRNFWDQPVLKTSLPGAGYTRFVRWMRLLLPTVAIGMLGLVLAWPKMDETVTVTPKENIAGSDVGKNELINPRFESEDKKSRPFTITARRAVQNAQKPDLVMLERPMADITLEDGSWMAAEADSGIYRQEAEKLLLEGHVRLFHDKGYEFKTARLLLDLENRQATSDEPVYGQGPAGTLQATGVRVDSEKELLVFTGPVKLVLNRSVKGM